MVWQNACVTKQQPAATSARIMAAFLLTAGVMHFANPTFFDNIVPPWLPPSERFWTYISGVGELCVGIGLLMKSTRRRAALGAFVLFLAVYPANLYMAWDWRDHALSDQLVAYLRLPLQFGMFWWALSIARANALPVAGDVLGFQERE
jgi:uncharacterized membrane protein